MIALAGSGGTIPKNSANGTDIMPRERKLQVLADWSSMTA